MSRRPTVSVIVPFAGSAEDLRDLRVRLATLDLSPADELVVADNRRDAAAEPVFADGMARVIPAAGAAAPGFARNRAARLAGGEWLVFLDADASPGVELLERYFDPLPEEGTAVLAGGILDRPGSGGAAALASARRGQMSQRVTLDRPSSPYAQTANCAVRRAAFEAVGGFDEHARWGEDADLCLRLAAMGWRLEERPGAVVEHPTRSSLAALVTQLAHHGSGTAWLHRRYPEQFAVPSVRQLTGRAAHDGRRALAAAARDDRAASGEAVVALLSGLAFAAGRLLSNRPRRT
jgi:GT2 family glycosyltransferase